MRCFLVLCLIWLFCVPVPLRADEVQTADGKDHSGKLIRIAENQFTLQRDQETEVIPAAEIIRVKLDSREPVVFPGGLLILANDDRLHAQLLRGTDEALFVRLTACPDLDELKVPLETIRAAFFRWPASLQTRNRLLHSLAQTFRKSDLFYLKNGDFLEGEFLGFDINRFHFESAAGETSVPRGGIEYFRFNPELINFPQPDELRYRLTLIDGSRLTVNSLSLDQQEVKARALFGAEFQCQRDRLTAITPLGGRSVPLADLEPAEYRFTPYFSRKWNWQRNRNVLSGPLISGGQEYASGLGMHSEAELRYELNGQYVAFESEVGLDDATGERAALEVQILVDGRVVFESELVRNENAVLRVPRIDLSGARQLTLKVNFGKNADIEDHLNWCNPVLIRKP